MKLTSITAAALVLVAPFVVEATQSHTRPPIYYEFVGLGEHCNDPSRQCRSPYACGTVPGRDGKYCIEINGPNGPCTQEFRRCTTGYKCVIPPYQYQGTCQPESSLKRRGYVEYVGFADTCNNVNRFCRDGRTCAPVQGRPNNYCVNKIGPNGTCDNEYNQCISGYNCVIAPGHYSGVCKSTTDSRQDKVIYVNHGESCDGKTRLCKYGNDCAPVPGRYGNYCVTKNRLNGSCDNVFKQCVAGLKCIIPKGCKTGTCLSDDNTTTGGYVEYVGLGDTCDNVKRICNNNFTCASVPGRPHTYCIEKKKLGETCDNEYRRCSVGYCDIKSGQYNGICRSW
jgi:hypothetical protein